MGNEYLFRISKKDDGDYRATLFTIIKFKNEILLCGYRGYSSLSIDDAKRDAIYQFRYWGWRGYTDGGFLAHLIKNGNRFFYADKKNLPKKYRIKHFRDQSNSVIITSHRNQTKNLT